MKHILTIILINITLIGCSTNYSKEDWYNNYDASRSKAMNVVITGNIQTRSQDKLKDMPYKEYEAHMMKAGYKADIETVAGVGLAAAKFSGNMIATSGISDAAGGTIMLLHALTKSDYDPVRYNGGVIWMPSNLVNNENEAKTYIESMLTKVFLDSLSDEYSYELTERVFTSTFGDPKTHKHYIISGGVCDEDPEIECKLEVDVRLPNSEKPAPQWISKKPVYHWSSAKEMPFAAVRVKTGPKGKAGLSGYSPNRLFIDNAMYLRISNALPEWIYLYSPYSKDRAFPVVYNKGEINYFIEPKPKEDPEKVALKQ